MFRHPCPRVITLCCPKTMTTCGKMNGGNGVLFDVRLFMDGDVLTLERHYECDYCAREFTEMDGVRGLATTAKSDEI